MHNEFYTLLNLTNMTQFLKFLSMLRIETFEKSHEILETE